LLVHSAQQAAARPQDNREEKGETQSHYCHAAFGRQGARPGMRKEGNRDAQVHDRRRLHLTPVIDDENILAGLRKRMAEAAGALKDGGDQQAGAAACPQAPVLTGLQDGHPHSGTPLHHGERATHFGGTLLEQNPESTPVAGRNFDRFVQQRRAAREH